MWIRMDDITDHSDLSIRQKIDLLAMAMEEYALATSLIMIHGKERGLKRYWEAGGHVNYDAAGEPVVWFEEKEST